MTQLNVRIYPQAIVSVTTYFEKLRSLATGKMKLNFCTFHGSELNNCSNNCKLNWFSHIVALILKYCTGIAVAGSGLGTFIFAPLIDLFIREYGWRGTLLVLSGIVLNCAAFGALFRPLTASTRQIAPAEQSDACRCSVSCL